jgi:hypothetical protein
LFLNGGIFVKSRRLVTATMSSLDLTAPSAQGREYYAESMALLRQIDDIIVDQPTVKAKLPRGP